jgi:16S rRNA (guanine966-N2)-methyltransferase
MPNNQIRIISGKWRGRKLTFPNTQGLRPTTDRTRETLFNWLAPIIEETLCLDLFAGSGALGIEALSRGAKKVIFVDQSPPVIKSLHAQCELLKCTDTAELHLKDALRFLQHKPTEPFDIIFLDPPFYIGLMQKAINLLNEQGWLKPGGYLYFEQEAKAIEPVFPEHWTILKNAKYGHVKVWLVKQGA